MNKTLIVLTAAITSLLLVAPRGSASTVLFEDDFDGYSGAFSQGGWSGGTSGNFSHEPSGGVNNSSCVKIRYDGGGTSPYWFNMPVPGGVGEFTLELQFKITGTPALGGCKFIKVFGVESPEPGKRACTTWALKYGSGNLVEVSYGPGTGTANDSQAVIKYGGDHTDPEVVINSSSSTFRPSEGVWNKIRVYMKYNNNGQRDGAYKVWINDQLRIDASNVRNRHDLNIREVDFIGLANYSSDTDYTHTWYLWYDSVVLTTGESPAPPPPDPDPEPDPDPISDPEPIVEDPDPVINEDEDTIENDGKVGVTDPGYEPASVADRGESDFSAVNNVLGTGGDTLALEWRIDPGRMGDREIRIYDMTGRAVMSVTEGLQDLTSARVTLSMEEFSSGVYFAIPYYGNIQGNDAAKFAVVR